MKPLVLAVMLVAGLCSGCAHAPGLDLARARCDRDGGQWVVEYDARGKLTRCACVFPGAQF